MGHNARDFARAAAVCRGWRAACRASTSALNLYRETVLHPIEDEIEITLAWSPCGKFVAAAFNRRPRLFIWRASTGALVNEWALATPATAVPQDVLQFAEECGVAINTAFSRDSTRVATLFNSTNHFAVWSMLDGRLLAVNRGDIGGGSYMCATFGVPGSASDGLIGFASTDGFIDLWDVSLPRKRGPSRPRLRSRVDVGPGVRASFSNDFSFSPDGSKFAAGLSNVAYVYDVASLTLIGAYTSPSKWAAAMWAPDGLRVVVSGPKSVCLWDFSRPEAPPIVEVCPGKSGIEKWSPNGASYIRIIKMAGRAPNGPATLMLEERKTADGSPLRAINLGPDDGSFLGVCISPDSHALALFYLRSLSARVVVFD